MNTFGRKYLVQKHTMRRKCLTEKLQPTSGDLETAPNYYCDCCDCSRKCNKVRVDHERIRALAIPKYREQKFTQFPEEQQLISANNKRRVTIVREPNLCERVTQLALPRVRYLTSTKNEFRPVIGEQRAKVLNMHIQNSLHTVYSRIANIPMPQRRGAKSTINWEQHKKWLETRALPKRVDQHTEEDLGPQTNKQQLCNPQHLDYLAQPKHRSNKYLPRRHQFVKPNALKYKITPAVLKLATPIVRPDEPRPAPYESPFPLSRSLRRIRSVGIAKLATPTRPRKFYARGDNASVVFTVSPAARKYVTTQRDKQRSKPKVSLQQPPKADPFKVSPNAISAKLTDKKIEIYKKLSTPMKRYFPLIKTEDKKNLVVPTKLKMK